MKRLILFFALLICPLISYCQFEAVGKSSLEAKIWAKDRKLQYLETEYFEGINSLHYKMPTAPDMDIFLLIETSVDKCNQILFLVPSEEYSMLKEDIVKRYKFVKENEEYSYWKSQSGTEAAQIGKHKFKDGRYRISLMPIRKG